jgi:hypothetical protein
MAKVFSWFATSPLATAARVGIGAALTFIIENIGGFNLDPAVQVAVIAAVSTALRWLTPADGIYGRHATEVDA